MTQECPATVSAFYTSDRSSRPFNVVSVPVTFVEMYKRAMETDIMSTESELKQPRRLIKSKGRSLHNEMPHIFQV